MRVGLKAVIFDWAGTMIDFGSRAPVIALCHVFEAHGVPITEAEAREDMGRAKRDHIGALLVKPRIAAAWQAAKGSLPSVVDGDMIFNAIGDSMRAAARECATLVPGAATVAQSLQAQGVKIGSCTGYSRDMMDDILSMAKAQGYDPNHVVCAGETPSGRPSPFMVWQNLIALNVWPAEACLKVDDTEVGIMEGRAAGVWTVGVVRSGNIVGLSEDALMALPVSEREARLAAARETLLAAGAHLVIDTVANLTDALAQLPTAAGLQSNAKVT
ncbi:MULTISPECIES: phosphonoacetaldehyde hydrolase [unclassified Sphingobium]|uniref:phosphonoacetaldehyde hydrolase n=1 Tax=unclassified Sphingobium TaxID=2611147 RepID=UPI0022249F68|nr:MULTISPECIES: phosphonoacetaldehyde hydrolase [unclassified Sphingobium]MCW2410721.1 phosphonoacetaldehyde hydrolase [Sphingobium sp. B8D3D]MCW2416989.1 phosphonoacetaldehyde hydrolase [Sphingobium sp. B8D3A]